MVCTPETYSQIEKKPIDTCKSFRGTSCRCTKDRHCLWIGIRPRGLGLRLISRQLQPKVPPALAGERWPFVACPFPFSSTGSSGMVEGLGVALAVGFRILIGLRLLDLALRKSPLTSPSSSIPSSFGIAAFFLADLVTGPKYPSCELSRVSEGVGEGEMTLGVAGIGFEDDRDMVKGGKEGMRIAPVNNRPISVKRRSQDEVEWRCLSFREARIVVTEGGEDREPVSSSGGDGAGQNCTASLEKVMVPLSVPLKWHTGLLGEGGGDERSR